MDEQQLIVEPPCSVCTFFHRLFYRFSNGNAPYCPSQDESHVPQQLPFSFTFDSHPGPMEDAIADAQNLHRALFVFVFCRENPLTTAVVSVLQRPSVAEEIRENFIFLPLDVTWPEGWRVAAEIGFDAMPFIALVRPRGSTLWESKVYVKYEGKVGEHTLLSSMRVERTDRNPDNALVRAQDDEFDRAVREDEEAEVQRAVAQIEEQRAAEDEERMRAEVNEAYERLLAEEPTDAATIRFQFPDNQTKTHKFARNGPVRNLFVFARKFMFPRPFVLMTGFPQRQLIESDTAVGDECRERQFIVYVQEDD